MWFLPLSVSRFCPNRETSRGSIFGPDPAFKTSAGERTPAELFMDRPKLAQDSSELRQAERKASMRIIKLYLYIDFDLSALN